MFDIASKIKATVVRQKSGAVSPTRLHFLINVDKKYTPVTRTLFRFTSIFDLVNVSKNAAGGIPRRIAVIVYFLIMRD